MPDGVDAFVRDCGLDIARQTLVNMRMRLDRAKDRYMRIRTAAYQLYAHANSVDPTFDVEFLPVLALKQFQRSPYPQVRRRVQQMARGDLAIFQKRANERAGKFATRITEHASTMVGYEPTVSTGGFDFYTIDRIGSSKFKVDPLSGLNVPRDPASAQGLKARLGTSKVRAAAMRAVVPVGARVVWDNG